MYLPKRCGHRSKWLAWFHYVECSGSPIPRRTVRMAWLPWQVKILDSWFSPKGKLRQQWDIVIFLKLCNRTSPSLCSVHCSAIGVWQGKHWFSLNMPLISIVRSVLSVSGCSHVPSSSNIQYCVCKEFKD